MKFSVVKRLSVDMAIVDLRNLREVKGGFEKFVNLEGPGNIPSSNMINLKSLPSQRNLRKVSFSYIFIE